jgi:hypothetical protein
MPLSERSQGFKWFFNFSIRKCYGAKDQEKFIYLFDEPGSYLHNSAQSILLKALVELSKNHPVIYSTHSEFLLDPEVININNIKVVEKQDREIRLVQLAEVKGHKKEGALSTLYNALKTKIPISSTINQKIVITEGITDFYFWKMVSKKLVILPGIGASSNEYLISIAIGTANKYVALFDGDSAGGSAITRYKRFFGEKESAHWRQYLNSSGTPVELEDLLSRADQDRLKTITGTPDTKNAITILYFSNLKDTFWRDINNESKANIAVSTTIIKRSLGITSKSIFKFQVN